MSKEYVNKNTKYFTLSLKRQIDIIHGLQFLNKEMKLNKQRKENKNTNTKVENTYLLSSICLNRGENHSYL